jgi:hypothetical protein
MSRDEPPPVFGSWRRLYVSILFYLAALIALFDVFTRSWNR